MPWRRASWRLSGYALAWWGGIALGVAAGALIGAGSSAVTYALLPGTKSTEGWIETVAVGAGIGALTGGIAPAAASVIRAGEIAIPQSTATAISGAGAGTVGSAAAAAAAREADSALAASATSGRDLGRQLAVEQQLAEPGEVIAGGTSAAPLRLADRLAAEYGGDPADWVKVSSSTYTGDDGMKLATHWYENTVTGQVVEPKVKFGQVLD